MELCFANQAGVTHVHFDCYAICHSFKPLIIIEAENKLKIMFQECLCAFVHIGGVKDMKQARAEDTARFHNNY